MLEGSFGDPRTFGTWTLYVPSHVSRLTSTLMYQLQLYLRDRNVQLQHKIHVPSSWKSTSLIVLWGPTDLFRTDPISGTARKEELVKLTQEVFAADGLRVDRIAFSRSSFPSEEGQSYATYQDVPDESAWCPIV
jgi:hypothetical protein